MKGVILVCPRQCRSSEMDVGRGMLSLCPHGPRQPGQLEKGRTGQRNNLPWGSCY